MRTDSMTRTQAEAAQIDVGLRQYMLRVYNYMALGVACTGIVAMLVAQNPAIMQAIALGPMKWVLFVGILGLGFFAPKIMMTQERRRRPGMLLGVRGDVGRADRADVLHVHPGQHRPRRSSSPPRRSPA